MVGNEDLQHVLCWACQTHLAIPTINGAQVAIFKVRLYVLSCPDGQEFVFEEVVDILMELRAVCASFIQCGWCGAISNNQEDRKRGSNHLTQLMRQ